MVIIKMANLTETNFARKVDSMGRITIPIRLREQVGIEVGQVYNYSILKDDTGCYLCIKCPGPNQEMIEAAKEILKQAECYDSPGRS